MFLQSEHMRKYISGVISRPPPPTPLPRQPPIIFFPTSIGEKDYNNNKEDNFTLSKSSMLYRI